MGAVIMIALPCLSLCSFSVSMRVLPCLPLLPVQADFNFPGAGYEDDAELRKVLSQLPDLQAAAG